MVKRLPPITDEAWENVCGFNKDILDEFIENITELSDKTRLAYYSNLRIWFIWVMENLDNKSQIEIKPLDFKKFQNSLVNRGCSSADCANKRAAISSLNNYLEVYHGDDYPTFRNFINKSIARPPKNKVHEKEPLTKEEFAHLISVLTEREEWQKVAYLKYTLETGCRRAESRQLLKEVAGYEPKIKEKIVKNEDGQSEIKQIKYWITHEIRQKGRGKQGKINKMLFGQDTMDAFAKWLEVRGEDDCPYMFVSNYNGSVVQVGESTFNSWCAGEFSEIVGRSVFPHLLRSSRATQLFVEDGVDISVIKHLLNHENITTTQQYIVKDDTDELDDLYMV